MIGINVKYKINDGEASMLAGNSIHLIWVRESETYLGVQINLWKGIAKPPLREMLKELAEKTAKAELKSDWLIYIAYHSMAGHVQLNKCDRGIRQLVETWLNLEPSITDGLLCQSQQWRFGSLQVGSTCPGSTMVEDKTSVGLEGEGKESNSQSSNPRSQSVEREFEKWCSLKRQGLQRRQN